MNPEKVDALRQEMKEDSHHYGRMREDEEYALAVVSSEIEKANNILLKVCRELEQYGYFFTPVSLLKEI